MLQILRKLFSTTEQDNNFPKSSLFIDVRGKFEFEQEHLDDTINIPLNLLSATVDLLKKYDVPIVIVAGTEDECEMAFAMLSDVGIRVFNGGLWTNLKNQMRTL